MEETGRRNPNAGADRVGLANCATLHWNWTESALLEEAVRRGEGVLTRAGAFSVETGKHTGRSVLDKFIVEDPRNADDIWWDNNRPMARASFDQLKADMIAFADEKVLFANDLYGGRHPDHRISVRVFTEYAWHSLFIRHLLVRPDLSEIEGFVPQFTVIDIPSFKADPERHGCRSETVIACDLENGLILIGGTSYAGEMKKSVFSILNHLLPQADILPMHCSAN
ncbi:MAG: phosphoenolpyruvate carboxykinase (ATP), partial [Pseudomonadota bacterium]